MIFSNSPTSLQIIRMIHAPVERVYAAWTDQDLARSLWSMDGGATEDLVLEPWRGGRLLWDLRKPDGGSLTLRGKFRRVSPREEIVHTWQWAGLAAWKDALSLVTVAFSEKPEAPITELRLSHENFPDESTRDSQLVWWNSLLDRIDKHLTAHA